MPDRGSSPALASPNFAFLAAHDPALVREAALAERHVFGDPAAALVTLRRFGELLARHAAAYAGLAADERLSQVDLLDRLRAAKAVDAQVSQLFHGLRKAGNAAAHVGAGDRGEALHQLRMARELAVWFHKAFGRDPRFKAGAFVPPPDPQEAERELRAELARLRDAEAAAGERADGAAATAAEHERRRREAETAAAQAYADLEAAFALAAETEAKLAAERSAYEERLAALQAAAAAAPAAEREQVAAVARAAAEAVDRDEPATRRIVDAKLREAGWEVDSETLSHPAGARPTKGRDRAIAEWPTANGPADYVLFAGLTPLAVVEAKRKRKDVAAALEQSKRYSRGYAVPIEQLSPGGPWDGHRVPFLFATNGRPFLRQVAEKSGIHFLDARRPTNHPRPLEDWYTPEGLSALLAQDHEAADAKLRAEPTDSLPLRDYQADAVRAVEQAIADGRRELLVAMATGTGKTVTCVGLIYRLVKARRFRRALFLVDRSALGEQATNAFKDVRLENHQSFADVYDVKALGDLAPDADTRLHVATVQGMVKRILSPGDAPPPPVDAYDLVVIDECHRGYTLDAGMTDAELDFRSEADFLSKYRRVVDHFDAVKVGLTATPALHTTEIFGPPVYEYSYPRAVVDGWLVDHEPPYRIVTALAEDGIRWKKGEEVGVFDTRTSRLDLFDTPDEVNVEIEGFNRKVITEGFNRAVCGALAAEIDPESPEKTLVFCCDDHHADMVVRLLKEAFDAAYGGAPDDAVVKLTGASDKPLQLLRRFKNERLPTVAVTVDLLTTGVDVPAIANLVFLRRVRSRILFEQMLGRATRLCENLYGPGLHKTRFRIFDAVEQYAALEDVTDMRPVVVRPGVSFAQLAEELRTVPDDAFRRQVRDEFAVKLARKRLSESQAARLEAAGAGFDELLALVRKSDPAALGQWLAAHPDATAVLDAAPDGGRRLLVSQHPDEVRRIERGYGAAQKPGDYLESFRKFVAEHADDLPALLVVAQRPRDLTRAQLRELKLALDAAGFTETNLRAAWRETTNADVAASIVGYVRYVALGEPLVAHADRVRAATAKILASRPWTAPQRRWLERIGKQLEQETVVDRAALDAGEFKAHGGFARLDKVFGGRLEALLREIADAVWPVAA